MTTREWTGWVSEKQCRQAVKSLRDNGFTALYFHNRQEAADYILNEAQPAETVGLGGSRSVADLGVSERLKEMGKEILVSKGPGTTPEEGLQIRRRQLTCDLFLTGTNALTLSGYLVNIDNTGNRVAAMTFGPQKVIVVAGQNKLVAGSIDDAIRRVKEKAAPPNARRLEYATPCAKSGFCSDCSAQERICRVVAIMQRKPARTDVRVLVVNESLGF